MPQRLSIAKLTASGVTSSRTLRFRSELLRPANRKHIVAYGYDVTGEVMEPGEQESRSPNLWDQGNSPKFDRTAPNPANQLVDAEAENDFPELKEFKHKRMQWPARTR